MAYWCDDRALALEQRRLDAEQARALEALRTRENAAKAASERSANK